MYTICTKQQIILTVKVEKNALVFSHIYSAACLHLLLLLLLLLFLKCKTKKVTFSFYLMYAQLQILKNKAKTENDCCKYIGQCQSLRGLTKTLRPVLVTPVSFSQ